MFTNTCFDFPLWEPEPSTALPAQPRPSNEAEFHPALPFIKITDWQDKPVPPREWTVKDRIPARNVTLLSGESSMGKSILSMQLAVAVVLGRDWLGTLPEQGPALVVNCEDEKDELWRRADPIFAHYGARYTDDFHLIGLAGKETLMAVRGRNGLIETTKLFKQMQEAACDIKPKLIVLDNSADIFAGSENDRAEVRQFVTFLRGLAVSQVYC